MHDSILFATITLFPVMGFFGGLFGTKSHPPAPVELLRLHLHMHYNPVLSRGVAALDWEFLAPRNDDLKAFVVVLLYARILVVHDETRTQLLQVVDELSKQNIRDGGKTGFQFREWTFRAGPGAPDQRIWPWQLSKDPLSVRDSKAYTATLLGFTGGPLAGRFGINLDMAWGQERVLAPSSALLAISSYAESTDAQGRYELALFLWQISEYYRSPDRVRIGSEPIALKAASDALRSGRLTAP